MPTPPLFSMDDARAAILRMLNNVLTSSSAEVKAAMETDSDKESNQYKNGETMLRAAAEFIAANAIILKKVTTPKILRTERSMKVIGKLHS
jgi:hypothetical protein